MNLNLMGPGNNLGYGIAFTNIVDRLMAQGHEVAVFPIGPLEPSAHLASSIYNGRMNAFYYDRDAPSIKVFHQDHQAEHVGRGKKVGFPFYELDPLKPSEVHHLNQLDLVIVASEWAKGVAERSGVVVPIAVVPLGVDRNIFNETVVADRLDGDQTVFFTVGKFEVRKGHDFLLEAFNKAFVPQDRVVLKLLCENPFLGNGNQSWFTRCMTSRMGACGRVVPLPRVHTQQDVASFMMSGDIGVFPARAEGWNLDLLEAMAMGKPVITTNYSAHTEYATAENARIIPVTDTEPAFDGVWFKGEGDWAKLGAEQEEILIEHMRETYRLHQAHSPPLNFAGIETSKAFPWENTAARLVSAVIGIE